MYGFYSAQDAAKHGTVIYKDLDGNDIHVTCVTDDPEKSGTCWSDIQALGPVGDFVSGRAESLFGTDGYKRMQYYESAPEPTADYPKIISKQKDRFHARTGWRR